MLLEALTETPEGWLSEAIRDGVVSEREAVRYAIDIATGIKQWHDGGRVAGDLTPERIRVAGLHASVREDSAESEPGPYSAPERWRGKAADRRSDIYSFGAVLYHMVSGRQPFAGAEGAALQEAVLEGEPLSMENGAVEWSAAEFDMRAGLARIAARCMVKNVERRCQRIQHVVLELKLLVASSRQSEFRAHDRREAMEDLLRKEVAGLTAAVIPRMDSIETQIAEVRQAVEAATTQVQAAVRVQGTLAEDLTAQASSIGSLETAICQTDDMVEHLVEAFDSLQTLVLERPDRKRAVAGTNGACSS